MILEYLTLLLEYDIQLKILQKLIKINDLLKMLGNNRQYNRLNN